MQKAVNDVIDIFTSEDMENTPSVIQQIDYIFPCVCTVIDNR